MPTTWMAGGEDPTYAAVAREAASAAGGRLVVVPGAGHNLVLEAPDAVGSEIDAVLAQA